MVFEHREGSGWGLPKWLEDAAAEGGFTPHIQELKQKEFEKNSERNERMVGRKTPTGLVTLVRTAALTVFSETHSGGSGSVLWCEVKGSSAKGENEGENAPELLAIANTHLVGDPEKADGQLRQLESLTKYMDKMESTKLTPTGRKGELLRGRRVILGDFNNSYMEVVR